MGVQWYQRQNQVRRRYSTVTPRSKFKRFLMFFFSLRFNVNRRISIVGFGLYGSIHGPTDYQVNIQVNPVSCHTSVKRKHTFSFDRFHTGVKLFDVVTYSI